MSDRNLPYRGGARAAGGAGVEAPQGLPEAMLLAHPNLGEVAACHELLDRAGQPGTGQPLRVRVAALLGAYTGAVSELRLRGGG